MSEPTVLLLIGASLVIVIIAIIIRRLTKVDRFEEFDLEREDEGEPALEKSVKKQKKKSKSSLRSSSGCQHQFEVTGYPADRVGTHVNLKCALCGHRFTATMDESRELFKQQRATEKNG